MWPYISFKFCFSNHISLSSMHTRIYWLFHCNWELVSSKMYWKSCNKILQTMASIESTFYFFCNHNVQLEFLSSKIIRSLHTSISYFLVFLYYIDALVIDAVIYYIILHLQRDLLWAACIDYVCTLLIEKHKSKSIL